MDNNMADRRGTIVENGNILRIDNGLIEEVMNISRNTGHIVVSYVMAERNGRISVQRIRLNVNRNTVVLNGEGQPVCFCDVRRGMWVNALFSSAVTRSIPPQSSAFIIVARREFQPAMSVTTERVVTVDPRNNFLITGNPRNINRQMRFVITNNTVILDQNGNRIALGSIHPGQRVRVTHANFQTASIPPQTTAYFIQLL